MFAYTGSVPAVSPAAAIVAVAVEVGFATLDLSLLQLTPLVVVTAPFGPFLLNIPLHFIIQMQLCLREQS